MKFPFAIYRSGFKSTVSKKLKEYRTEAGANAMLAKLKHRFPKNDYWVMLNTP